MIETFGNLATGFSVALSPGVLLYAFLGCLVGTLVGVLPGVGPLAGISLLLPITFGLDATRAIVMLAGIYYGAMYGGSTTSILMSIPGEAASVMTCIDGYQMARKGRAGPALTIAAVGSYIAGTASVVGLMLLAPPLASFALRFGPPEYFALLSLGLLVLAYMSSGPLSSALGCAQSAFGCAVSWLAWAVSPPGGGEELRSTSAWAGCAPTVMVAASNAAAANRIRGRNVTESPRRSSSSPQGH